MNTAMSRQSVYSGETLSVPRFVQRLSAALRMGASLLLLTFVGLLSACGSSSKSFVSIDAGPTAGATLTSISVEPANSSLPRGLTRQFTAMAIYSDGTKLDVSSSVTWTSSASNVATINAIGVLTAVNLGTTTVAAAIGTISGSTTLTVTAASLVSIEVTPMGMTIAKGTSQLFTATGVYTDYSTQDISKSVTWTSSNTLVASIGNAPGTPGLAFGISGGTTTITATLGAAIGSTVLTVSGASLNSITVTPTNPSVPKGSQPVQFTATGNFTDGTQQNLTTSVTWSSSNAAVATISNVAGTQGLATPLTAGMATITAATAGLAGSTTLTVTPASLLSISVTPVNPSIPKGLTQTFTATGTYSDGSTMVLTAMAVWNSATPTVATISNAPATAGMATGLMPGTSVITATVGAIVSAPVTLTVTPAALVSIAVTPVNPTVLVGGTVQFVATGTYTDGTMMVITTAVTWNSATPTVASISNAAGPPNTQGLATALTAGTTLITATFPGPPAITSPPQTLTVKSNYAYATNTAAPGIMGTISQYSIGPNGTLTPLAMAEVDAGINPFSIAINPAGTYAYVANYNKSGDGTKSTISQYSISPTTGALTAIGTTGGLAGSPNSVTIDPLGLYVYISDNTEPIVSEFKIQPDGTLGNELDFPAGNSSASIAINPADKFAYVANYNDGTVWQYAIGGGGALAAIPGEPLFVNAQAGSSYVIVDPAAPFVYVTNQNAGSVSEYSIGGDGSLTPIGTVTTGSAPSFIAIDPSGTHAYVADSGSDEVSQFNINGGMLTPMAVATVATRPGSVPYSVTIDATGKYLYVAERITMGAISQFNIDPMSGALTAFTPLNVPAGAAPTSIATTPPPMQ